MIDPDTAHAAQTIREQAVDWFSRQRLGPFGPAEQRALEAWLAAAPEHRRQFEALQEIWQLTDHLSLKDARAILGRDEGAVPARNLRRRLLIGAGAGCALLAAGLAGRQAWQAPPQFSGRFSTARGERRRITLPDGSVLDLNTASEATIAYYENGRVATLQAGEALFSVHADAARPFTVVAGEACVRVMGTRFNVRHDPDSVQVAVTDGAVKLSAGPWWRRGREVVSAGQVAVATKAEGVVPPYPDHVESIAAWQRGRLMFRDTPLSQVASELNRYLPQPVRLADAGLARLRISGTLSIDAPEAALDLLPLIAPIVVIRGLDGRTTLAPR